MLISWILCMGIISLKKIMTSTTFMGLVPLLLTIGKHFVFSMNFENLNEDCIRHIFELLDLNELYVVSNVSMFFRNAVNNLNMKLSYTMTVDIPTDYNKIENFFSRIGHHIEKIKIVESQRENHNLSYVYHMMDLLEKYCFNVKYLRFEHFSGIKIIDIEKHFDLEILELENSSLCTSVPCNDLNTTIKSVTLNSCTSNDISILLEYLKINDKIRHLRIVNCCLCMNETMTGLFNDDIVTCLQNLQCLTLDYSVKCSNLQLISRLDNLKKLFLLHFSENKLIKLFDAYASKEHCQVQEIHFHMCTISSDTIYKSLSKMKSLEVLEMCKNFGMTSNHMNILTDCKNLTHLRCFDCIQLISDEGICHLVSKCDKLRKLEIYWCSGVTLSTIDKIENINKLMERQHFTFRIGGRTGINWNDSGPLPSISKVCVIQFIFSLFD